MRKYHKGAFTFGNIVDRELYSVDKDVARHEATKIRATSMFDFYFLSVFCQRKRRRLFFFEAFTNKKIAVTKCTSSSIHILK